MSLFICAIACTTPEITLGTDEKGPIEVTFRPSLDGSLATRSIGDAGRIDRLRIGVYKEASKGLSRTDILTKPWSEVQKEGVSMKFDGDATYRIVFWAEDSDNTAYHIHVPSEALKYSRVTIYYSDDADFNVHSAKSVSTQDFDYNGGFSISLAVPDLTKMYHYCLFIESESRQTYGPIEELKADYEIDVCYENGTYTGKGYYSSTVTSSIINGFALPVLKSHMPESISGVMFYIKGSDDYFQPLTAYIGYMTDPTKANTLKIIKEQTSKAYVTTSFAKVMLPLELSREELAEVPDDGVIYVGFYPPEGYADKPLGCGYISQTDPGYTETMDHKGLYSYQNVSNTSYTWGVSSPKAYRYFALLVTF